MTVNISSSLIHFKIISFPLSLLETNPPSPSHLSNRLQQLQRIMGGIEEMTKLTTSISALSAVRLNAQNLSVTQQSQSGVPTAAAGPPPDGQTTAAGTSALAIAALPPEKLVVDTPQLSDREKLVEKAAKLFRHLINESKHPKKIAILLEEYMDEVVSFVRAGRVL